MDFLDEQTKGCVYFFKHLGLSPVKIGYSSSPSPIKRFEAFKTYAPFGAELVGFIQVANAKELESRIHSKFQTHRLEGEWFDIDAETVSNTINHYSTISQNEDRNLFMIAYAIAQKKKEDERRAVDEISSIVDITNLKAFKSFKNMIDENQNFNRAEIARSLNVSRQTIYNWIKQIEQEKQ